MPVLERANAELVGVAWLKSLPELPAGQIATTIPKEPADEFATNGFVTVTVLGGGPDGAMQRSVLEVSTWAYDSDIDRRPKAKAANLWAAIKASLLRPNRWVTLSPASFGTALVRHVRVLADPRLMPNDRYVRFAGDIQIDWTQGGIYG